MSMQGRPYRWLLPLVLVLGLVAPTIAQERPLTATCDSVEWEPLVGLDSAVIPVMVTYMVYTRRASEDTAIFATNLVSRDSERGLLWTVSSTVSGVLKAFVSCWSDSGHAASRCRRASTHPIPPILWLRRLRAFPIRTPQIKPSTTCSLVR